MKRTKISLIVLSLIIELCLAQNQNPSKTFSCHNGEYIENSQYCDGLLQCSDGSDEPPVCGSTRKNCELGKYYCPTSGSCSYNADQLSDLHVQQYCSQSENKTTSNNESTNSNFFSNIEILLSGGDFSSDPKFICDEKKCWNVNYVCKGYCDCFNCSGGSNSFPEVGIVPKLEVNNCSSLNDKFLCADNKRCLNLDYVCDGYCNCFDCSDENGECSIVDYKMLGTCPDYYFPTPSGLRCLRDLNNSSNTLSSPSTNQLKNCDSKHLCDQKCTQYKTRAICSCNDGYTKISTSYGGFKCQKEFSQNALLYSTPKKIKLLNLTTGEAVVIKDQVDCKLLTAAHDFMYYTDDTNRIFKRSLNLEDSTEIKLDNLKDGPISSIAVDYITENLYFTTNTTLSVCGSDNRICMGLLFHNVNYIALAPSYGWMFYAVTDFDSDEMYIMKNNMDGSNETTLIDGSFRTITALSADESIRRLYGYSSSRGEFFSVSFYSDNSEYRTFSYHGSVVSIAALDSRMFFTMRRDRQIYVLENNEYFTKPIDGNAKISKYPATSKSSELVQYLSDYDMHLIEGESTFAVEYLHAYDPSQQRSQKFRNTCSPVLCSGLCLLRSMNSASGSRLGSSCFCRDVSSTTYPFWCDKSTPTSTISSTNSYKFPSSTPYYNASEIITIFDKGSSMEGVTTNYTGLETVGCIIALCIVLLCVGYISYNKWKQYYYNSVLRNAAQHQCSDQGRLYFGQEDL